MSEERRAKDRRPGERRTAPRASRPGSRASYAAHAAEGVRPTRHEGEEKRPERRPGGDAAGGPGGKPRADRPQSARFAGTRRPAAVSGAQARSQNARPSGASHALHAQAHSGHGLAPRSPRPRTAQSGLNARRLALDVLTDVREKGAYASLALGERLRAAHLSPEDRRLATGLVYGTLENQLQIDYALDRLMDHPTREPVQRDILRMGAYQILFLDRVPDSAAVDEAVKLTRAMGMEAACGFINAVLRNLSRGKDEIAWPDREADPVAYLSVMGSMPRWLVDKLVAAYGPEEAGRVILYREEEHPVCVRPNFTRLSDAEFEALLQEKGWRAERGLAPHAWLIYGAGDLAADADYRAGRFSIQGQSSMLAAEALEARPGMKVLDACAAPGGKSAYLCEQMQLTGRVYAWELHEKRAQLLEGVRRRLGLDNLRISVRDALDFRPDLEGALDGVLLDAPCAGLGVLSQKPDIKLRLKEEDIPAIVDTQGRLIDTVCRYVRPGGALVYSTCSLLPEENADRVRAFLQAHPNFTLEPLPTSFPEELRARQTPCGLQLLGCRDGVEGFFIARMRRVR